MNYKIILSILVLSVCLQAGVHADVIHLKNGKAYAGKIVDENVVYVRLDMRATSDIKVKEFLQSDIARIERGTMTLPEPTPVVSPTVIKEEVKEEPTVKIEVKKIKAAHKENFPAGSTTITDEDIADMLDTGPTIEEVKFDQVVPEAEIEEEPEESAAFSDKDIQQMLLQEQPKQPEVVQIEIPQEQIAEMEAQMAAFNTPHNKFKMMMMAIGMLLGMCAIPLGICGVIGFFLARKFDDEEEEVEVIETIKTPKPPKTPEPQSAPEPPKPLGSEGAAETPAPKPLGAVDSADTPPPKPLGAGESADTPAPKPLGAESGSEASAPKPVPLGQPTMKATASITPPDAGQDESTLDSSPEPEPASSLKPDAQPSRTFPRGGLIRRLLARIVDLYLGAGLIALIYSLLGFFMPMDQIPIKIMLGVLIPLMFIFFFYFFLGIAKLKNTYGHYLMNICVVDFETNTKLSLGQAFKRDFLAFLWPIDIFVLIFSKAKRRIGDRFAGTKVIIRASQHPWWKRLIPGVLTGVFIFGLLFAGSPYINDRMTISAAAKDYLGRKHGADKLTKPRRVEIENHEGSVHIKLTTGECFALHLTRQSGRWIVDAITPIPENVLGWGYSITYN